MEGPKYEEFYYLISGKYPFVDIVTETDAYAFSVYAPNKEHHDCYHITVDDECPYDEDRGDWEPIAFDEFPDWVQKRCKEVEPILRIMEPV